MWEQEVAFWVLAIAMAAAAIGVVRTSNIVHAALFLVVVLAGAAAQYLLLVAEFVAWAKQNNAHALLGEFSAGISTKAGASQKSGWRKLGVTEHIALSSISSNPVSGPRGAHFQDSDR